MLPKTAGSAQTHKSISLIWIVWSTLYVYLWLSRKLIVAPILCFQSYNIESSSFSYWLFKISLNCAKFQQDWKKLILNTYVGPGGIFIKKWNEFGSQFPLCLSSICRRKEIQYCVCCYVLDVNALPFFIHYKQDWPPIYLHWDLRNLWHSPVWNNQFDELGFFPGLKTNWILLPVQTDIFSKFLG